MAAEQPASVPMTNAKYLFHGLAWPAVAGNVAWAFFTLVIAPPAEVPEGEWAARTAVLLLMALYLGGDWVRTKNTPGGPAYWFFDAVHLILICLFVIGIATTQSQVPLNWYLGLLFIFTLIGHWSGAFTPEEPDCWWYGGASLLGAIVLIVWLEAGSTTDAWYFFGSVGAALASWVFFRLAKPWKWPEQRRRRKTERAQERQDAERVKEERLAAERGAGTDPAVNPATGQTETGPPGTELPKPGPHAQ